ncbi:winged helix-turn-helix domain-containing protein [Actinoplanes sp. NBC_00393]|uniref:ArsR/SmtB family transcription factor n=1 Tax=Actinoplanes sp. NBC_00393 TaxID=2975953 RepID=UPI002E1B3050
MDADTLAGSRFVLSPLAETTAALSRLRWDMAGQPAERDWLRAHHPAYAAHLTTDPVTAALAEALVRPRWISDLVARPPQAAERSFADELAELRATPPPLAREQLTHDGRLPAGLDRDDLADRAADLLTWVWRQTVEPEWPRRRRLLEADVLARTRQLSIGGWAAALDRMRGGVRWLGGGRLQINGYDNPPRDISGSRLYFVPVTLSLGCVAWHEQEPRRYAVIYQCAGLLADAGRPAPEPGALGRLLGPVRARVLIELEQPRTTSQLVALTGQALGSIGRHLKILLEAGLVARRRAGRNVLYTRTPAGDTLVHAAATPPSPS